MALQNARGTHDLLPEIQAKHNMIIEAARAISERYGFHEMSTPIFEFSDVFKRTLGEASDIVNKEMYTFHDRSEEELTLRPEGAAGIARSFISEGLSQRVPFKVFYQGPMFRYERPQKGRYRQFHQFGVEIVGVASPFADVECLSLAYSILKALKVSNLSRLEINSLGDEASRKSYIESLVRFLSQQRDKLSPDSQRRLGLNPLRILDSKDPKDHELLKNAPVISEFYTDEAKSVFNTITSALSDLQIPFEVNPFLVRGLDYYNHCVFEFKTTNLGAQDAILSGGRYDQLISQMGGPQTPGFGWAAGIERLALLSPLEPAQPRPLAIIPIHASAEADAFRMACELRDQGFNCEIAYSGNLSKRMKKASAQNAWAAILIGPDELARGEVTVKLLDDGSQVPLKLSDLQSFLNTKRV